MYRNDELVTSHTVLPAPPAHVCAGCGASVLLKDYPRKWRDRNFPPESRCKRCNKDKNRNINSMSFRDYYEQ